MVRGPHCLHRAAGGAHLAKVVRLLEEEPSLATALDARLRTPLHYAAAGGIPPHLFHHAAVGKPVTTPATREAIVRMLLAAHPQGAVGVDAQGLTPLHFAAAFGHIGAVRLLLRHAPAAATMLSFDGDYPLHLAARCPGAAEAVAALLAVAPWAALQPNGTGCTPLFLAALDGLTDAALLLLEAAPQAATMPHTQHMWGMRRGWVPLHAAARKGDLALAAALLAAAPETALAGDANADLPVHWAAEYGEGNVAAMLHLLLEAAPETALARDKDGDTPLSCAANRAQAEQVAVLVAFEPEAARMKNNAGRTPLGVLLQRYGLDIQAAARPLLEVGPAGLLVEAVARALGEARGAPAALLAVIPPLVARHALSPAEYEQLPAEVPGLTAALPAVLARSEGEAALLVAHMPEGIRARLQAAARALGRAQRQTAVPLPGDATRLIMAAAYGGGLDA